MGQYHLVVNLDKKQFLHPHQLGDGLKLGEFAISEYGVMSALGFLLAVSVKGGARGGGDMVGDNPDPLIGSWGGDRIAIVGDYAENTDLPLDCDPDPSSIYDRCVDKTPEESGYKAKVKSLHAQLKKNGIDTNLPLYLNISAPMRDFLESTGEVNYTDNGGWADKKVTWRE